MSHPKPEYESYILKEDGEIPNNPNLPLVIYPEILNKYIDEMNEIFLKKGWHGTWIGNVYDYHHYHSTAHEVLGVLSGNAVIQFGGKDGVSVEARTGDVIMIPAGVAHKNIQSSHDFRVVGGYPEGQEADLCTMDADKSHTIENIHQVPLPHTDPVFGDDGKLLDLWAISY